MKKTGFLYDHRYMLHETGNYHPEIPERLKAIYQGIESEDLLSELSLIKAVRADIEWVQKVHDNDYIIRLQDACVSGVKVFEYPDNQMCSETFETALLAAGGVIEAAKMIAQGDIKNAFCAIRPPGHHAEYNQSMGFCYFNNVAIAARYLQSKWGIERISIVDIDVHHGNGTQHIFEKDPSVFYYSIHEHPSFAFPGTGRAFEKGEGPGIGFTLNNPVLPGEGDPEYEKYFNDQLMPALEKFDPQFLIVSTGFDAHVDDNMSGIHLSTNGYSSIMRQILEFTEKSTQGRTLSVLEGGYALNRLPELAANHVKILIQGP